jgi:transcriptional regulator with XRE-family HTH domain
MMWMKGRRDCNGSEKIGNLLKKLRSEKGLTQEQLAEILNVSNRTVSRWETGSNMPDISLLVEIADFYDISIPEIINGERKSEKMNEEVKEVAKTMSDYARAEKEAIVKNIRIISVIGLVAFVVHALLDATGLHLKSSVLSI